MSESVKIGAVRNNPAVDKINTVNAMEAKDYTVKRMEEMLIIGREKMGEDKNRAIKAMGYIEVPVHFPIEKL